MPLTSDQLKRLKTALGADGGELFDAVSASNAVDVAELDRLKAKAVSVDQVRDKLDAAVKERDKYRADFEASDSGEAIEKLTAERDRALAKQEKAEGALKQFQTEQRTSSIKSQLEAALFDGKPMPADPEAAKKETQRRAAAMKLLTVDGLPEGIDLDENGKLVGHVEPLQTFKDSYGFVLEAAPAAGGGEGGGDGGAAPPAGHGGSPPGSSPNPNASHAQPPADKAAIARAEGAKMASSYLDSYSDPYRQASASAAGQ
jgi:hypothetical protein